MTIMIGVLTALVILLLILGGVLAFSNARLWVEIIGMKNSTHQIQYIDPMEQLREHKLSSKEEQEINEQSNNPMGSII